MAVEEIEGRREYRVPWRRQAAGEGRESRGEGKRLLRKKRTEGRSEHRATYIGNRFAIIAKIYFLAK